MDKILEYLPLIAFFITYKLNGAIFATKILVAVTIATSLISYIIYRKISKLNIISAVFLIFFGSLTIYTNNPFFLKIKPTILYVIFSLILLFGLLTKSLYIKHLFNNHITLSDEKWHSISKKFIIFFLITAVLNEIVWRNYSENFWVNFKVIGLPIITIFYFAIIIYQLKDHIHHDKI